MEPVGAIVFLPREGNGPSLMLEDLLFDPAARWLAGTLSAQGVARFFVVCHADDRERAVPCFPEGTEFVTTDTEGAVTKLSAFLDGVEGPVAVVTRPVVLLPAGQMALRMHNPPRETGLFTLEASALAAALEEGAELEAALRAHGAQTPEGRAIPLTADLGDRAGLENVVKSISTGRLAAEGVRVIDPFNTYVGPQVRVEAGTVLLPGTILRGETVIGADCEIGPNSMITSCKIGDRVTVNASQLLESTVEEGAKIGPFAYIRPHCRVGREVKVGDFVELKNTITVQEHDLHRLIFRVDDPVFPHPGPLV